MSRSRESLALAERVARELLTATRQGLPVDLQRVASHVGVAKVEYVPMVEDGRATWTSDGPVIQLNPARPEGRQRFTFAHELGHVVLGPSDDPERVVYRRAMCDSEIDEEQLCDAFAAALLMPRPWVQDQIRFWARPTFSLNMLRSMSARSGVSISATAARVTDVSRQLCAIVRWTRIGGLFVSTHKAAIPVELAAKKTRLGPRTQARLATIRRSESTWFDGDLMFDDVSVDATMQLSLDGTGLMMLITEIKDLRLGEQ